MELFEAYPWGGWDAFEAAPLKVKRQAWDWLQVKRAAEHKPNT